MSAPGVFPNDPTNNNKGKDPDPDRSNKQQPQPRYHKTLRISNPLPVNLTSWNSSAIQLRKR